MRRWIVSILVALAVVTTAVYAAFQFSPWPTVLLIRHAFGKDAAARNLALEKHLPKDIVEIRNQRYGDGAEPTFDVFFPARARDEAKTLPAVVWIHGGAFVAGDKSDVAQYLKILAGHGYTTVGVGYTTAPGARYPTPVLQANRALGFILRNASRFHIDTSRVFLAGDSAGSQIAAQLAAGIGDPAYAKAVGFTPSIESGGLKGVVLFCGVYNASTIDLDGPFGGFIRTTMWSYFGNWNFSSDPRLAQFSVDRHIPPQFPPTFVSVGNADPLKPQSILIADAIRAKGTAVDTLYFDDNRKPPLAHEYQFNLDDEAGREALQRLTAFLAREAR